MTLTQDTKPSPAQKAGQARKKLDDKLAAEAITLIALAHAQPRFDLTVEPWIPVLRDGEVVNVGLRELLMDAHHISDVAIPHVLLRASMRRFLGAMTADLVRRDRTRAVDYWEDEHAANTGFTKTQVDVLLAAHGEHLWLWHPHTPFLQDQRLARDLVKPHADKPVQELLLHLPSGSSAVWWVKAGEPALLGGLSVSETALWLTARWFYAVNGNCGDLRLPDGKTVGAQAGGSFAETVATVTHVFRVDGLSLFRSLLRGLPNTLTERTADPAGGPDIAATSCAWLDPQQPRPVNNPLYLATLNPSAVLLSGCDETGDTTRFVLGSTPVPGAQAKEMRDLAMGQDQHRITSRNDRGAAKVVRVPPGSLRGDILRAFHRAGFDGQRLTGVVNSSDCWLRTDAGTVDQERLDILLVSKGGTGSSPVWEDLNGLELPARHVDPAHPNPSVVQHVRAAVQIAFDPENGVRKRLERAVADLLAQPSTDGWKRTKPGDTTARAQTEKALTDKAVNAWLAGTSAAFEQVLDSDDPDAISEWRTAVWSEARAAFDDIASPYLTSTRYAPRYAEALHQLTVRSTT